MSEPIFCEKYGSPHWSYARTGEVFIWNILHILPDGSTEMLTP